MVKIYALILLLKHDFIHIIYVYTILVHWFYTD